MNIDEIKKLKIGEILLNVNLKKYTTYKVGGNALVLAIPDSRENLIKLLHYIKDNNIKHKILGFGSNLIFNDASYNGILIKLDKLNNVEINGNEIYVEAGYSLIKLSLLAARNSLTGLEFASGIPGSVGGAIFMNAGAYKSDMGYIVKEAEVLTPNYEIITMQNKDLDFHYRTSFLQKNEGYICLSTRLILQKGNEEAILNLIRDRKLRRIESQPLEFPSAGSVFRNPEGDFAGRLVESIGYKGYRIGDAMVSIKHANFIVNVGNAKGEDIKKLILEIQEKINQKYNIKLKIEQEFVD